MGTTDTLSNALNHCAKPVKNDALNMIDAPCFQ